MKKTNSKILVAALLSAAVLFTSCQSSKTANTTADVYDTDDSDKTAISSSSSDNAMQQIQLQNKNKNAIQSFFSFGNKDDYVRYDSTTVFTKEITGGLKEKDADVYIRTDDLRTGFGSYYLAAYYIIQFDENNRKKLENAVEKYLSDFENKKLNRKDRKSEKTYGKIKYRLDWGSISSSTPNHGEGEGYLGYTFVKGSPYFTISNYPFNNDYYEVAGDSTSRESLSLTYFFTKAQAKQLVERTAPEYVNRILNGTNEMPEPSEVDAY